jgi:hypothetical protein
MEANHMIDVLENNAEQFFYFLVLWVLVSKEN